MCNVGKSIRSRTYTGCKVAFRHEGRYYSPATLAEYKKGPVPPMPEIPEARAVLSLLTGSASDGWDVHFDRAGIFNPKSYVHKRSMTGMTAVFSEADDAIYLAKKLKNQYGEVDVVVLQMRISKDLHEGAYGIADADVVLGRRIVSIDEAYVVVKDYRTGNVESVSVNNEETEE
jgi:hypothetical protein